MKKAIIILTILSLLSFGFVAYEGYLYIGSLNTLNDLASTKNDMVKSISEKQEKNIQLENEYNTKTQDLLKNNIECELWKNLEEVLKKIKE